MDGVDGVAGEEAGGGPSGGYPWVAPMTEPEMDVPRPQDLGK